MEIVFVTVIGAGIGGLIRYLVPGRRSYGLALLPGIGAAVTAVVWVILLWLGWTFDGGWIWTVSITAGAVASLLTALLLPRARAASDARRLHELSGGRI
ncbi:hypothetical protein [Protaetiibacter intestinalis]|uniref:GlsB/YeaQ/YmgE family stress response membrane protein n=1 Tax=Protaetiibacter intestinalis TaxID=2419774 RepID=A0A387B443_9MICO|nr:hypothetical protein [Protaetiibacter intestinalis]AYF97077.1 hypothetical protein D7I47_01640 [Protaetiibacter intestinalis]